MALIEEGDHCVDHGQAGADQQHRCMRIEFGKRVGRPRVGPIVAGIVERRVAHLRDLGRKIADREDGDIRIDPPAMGAAQSDPGLASVDADDLAAAENEAILVGVLQLAVEEMTDIAAEGIALDEPLWRSQSTKSRGRSENALIRPAGTLSRWLGLPVE